MESIEFSHSKSGFNIEGIPDGIKVVELKDRIARRMADLALHRHDLEFARESLKAVNSMPADPPIIRESLWRSAIIHFLKCFGDGLRFRLSAEKILKAEPEIAIEVFQYFRNLRNKHLVHDENSYTQCLPAAILNDGLKTHKIEKIVCMEVWVQTLEQQNYSNLSKLIDHSLSWVIAEFDRLADSITAELETKTYEELISMGASIYRKPTIGDLAKGRR